MTHTTQEEEWEKGARWGLIWPLLGLDILTAKNKDELGKIEERLKDFIRTTRQQAVRDAMEELRKKVEGMKRYPPPSNDEPFDWGVESSETEYKRKGFNDAISDVIRLLTSTE